MNLTPSVWQKLNMHYRTVNSQTCFQRCHLPNPDHDATTQRTRKVARHAYASLTCGIPHRIDEPVGARGKTLWRVTCSASVRALVRFDFGNHTTRALIAAGPPIAAQGDARAATAIFQTLAMHNLICAGLKPAVVHTQGLDENNRPPSGGRFDQRGRSRVQSSSSSTNAA